MNAKEVAYIHEDHPEGAAVVEAAYPQILRDQVELDCFDNDIKDGDSNAVYSFQYGEFEGEIFDDVSGSDYWEIYPHNAGLSPVLARCTDHEVDEADFLKDAVLQTLGAERG